MSQSLTSITGYMERNSVGVGPSGRGAGILIPVALTEPRAASYDSDVETPTKINYTFADKAGQVLGTEAEPEVAKIIPGVWYAGVTGRAYQGTDGMWVLESADETLQGYDCTAEE